MYQFECKDLGFDDGVKITGESVDEVTRKVIDHAWRDHDIKAQSSKEADDLVKTIRSKIHEVR